jgi:hypothetical protein
MSGLQKPFAHNALNKALNGVNIPIDPFTVHDLRRVNRLRKVTPDRRPQF